MFFGVLTCSVRHDNYCKIMVLVFDLYHKQSRGASLERRGAGGFLFALVACIWHNMKGRGIYAQVLTELLHFHLLLECASRRLVSMRTGVFSLNHDCVFVVLLV